MITINQPIPATYINLQTYTYSHQTLRHQSEIMLPFFLFILGYENDIQALLL